MAFWDEVEDLERQADVAAEQGELARAEELQKQVAALRRTKTCTGRVQSAAWRWRKPILAMLAGLLLAVLLGVMVCGGCPIVEAGTCSACSGTCSSTCTAVSCDANRFDTNGAAADGCEAGCGAVAGGSCGACSDASTCTEVRCDVSNVDANGDAADGCEVVCPAITAGICTACSSALACTALRCDGGHLDADGDPATGCEACTCTNGVPKTGAACASAGAAMCESCSAGWAINGAESACVGERLSCSLAARRVAPWTLAGAVWEEGAPDAILPVRDSPAVCHPCSQRLHVHERRSEDRRGVHERRRGDVRELQHGVGDQRRRKRLRG